MHLLPEWKSSDSDTLNQALVVKTPRLGILVVPFYEAPGLLLLNKISKSLLSRHPWDSRSASSGRPTPPSETLTVFPNGSHRPHTSSGRGFSGVPASHGRVPGNFMPYALMDFNYVRVFINCIDVENPLRVGPNTQYKFDVCPVAELTIRGWTDASHILRRCSS